MRKFALIVSAAFLASCQQPVVWSGAESRILVDPQTREQFVCGKADGIYRCSKLGAAK